MGRLTPADHSTDIAGMRYVYPVVSRRAGGVSIGVNLNPNAACNWRCLYCQVPGLTLGAGPPIELDLLEAELTRTLAFARDPEVLARWAPEGARRLIDVAFSGDGEPTTSPDFESAVARVVAVLEREGLAGTLRIVLITNGSLAQKSTTQAGLVRLARAGGEVWFKLDSATAAGLERINGARESPEHHLAGLRASAELCPTWIQTCFVAIDGAAPSEVEQRAYLDAVTVLVAERVPLRGVMLYTLARPSHHPDAAHVGALDPAWLRDFAQRIESAGLPVRVAD